MCQTCDIKHNHTLHYPYYIITLSEMVFWMDYLLHSHNYCGYIVFLIVVTILSLVLNVSLRTSRGLYCKCYRSLRHERFILSTISEELIFGRAWKYKKSEWRKQSPKHCNTYWHNLHFSCVFLNPSPVCHF